MWTKRLDHHISSKVSPDGNHVFQVPMFDPVCLFVPREFIHIVDDQHPLAANWPNHSLEPMVSFSGPANPPHLELPREYPSFASHKVKPPPGSPSPEYVLNFLFQSRVRFKGMRKRALIFSLFFMLISVSSFSQTDALSELKQEIRQGNFNSVLLLATEPSKTKDADIRQYLAELTANSEQTVIEGSPAYFAQIVLAKLGDEDAISQIISEVEAGTPIHAVGMKKLFLVGGKLAFKKFHDLLDDPTQIELIEKIGDKNLDQNDVFFYPKNVMAIFYLSQMVENPPTRAGVPSDKIGLWKEWFVVNRHLIE